MTENSGLCQNLFMTLSTGRRENAPSFQRTYQRTNQIQEIYCYFMHSTTSIYIYEFVRFIAR